MVYGVWLSFIVYVPPSRWISLILWPPALVHFHDLIGPHISIWIANKLAIYQLVIFNSDRACKETKVSYTVLKLSANLHTPFLSLLAITYPSTNVSMQVYATMCGSPNICSKILKTLSEPPATLSKPLFCLTIKKLQKLTHFLVSERLRESLFHRIKNGMIFI